MAAPLDPDEAVALMRAAGFEPLEPFTKSINPWKCRCTKCGEISRPRHSNVRRGRGCGPCNKPTVTPDQAAKTLRAAGAEPLEPYPGKNTIPWRSRCLSCGREVSPRYANIQQGRGPCIDCGRTKTAAKLRTSQDAAATVMRSLGAEPLVPYVSRSRPWRCRCIGCGRVITPTLGNALQHGNPCGRCSVLRRGLAMRLDPAAAHDIMLSGGMEPTSPYVGYDDPWPSKCQTCGRPGSPRLSNIIAGQGGCWSCAAKGFKPHEASLVYVIRHRELGAAKVGVANMRSTRLSDHARLDWEVEEVWNLTSGVQARSVEQAFLRWVRETLALAPAVDRRDMPRGGATETWSTTDLDVATACSHIALLVHEASPISQAA